MINAEIEVTSWLTGEKAKIACWAAQEVTEHNDHVHVTLHNGEHVRFSGPIIRTWAIDEAPFI